jgi:hypothetical protein
VPPSTCPGDDEAPSGAFALSGGSGAETGYTAATNVTVQMSFSDPCSPVTVQLSNDGTTWGAPVTYDPLDPSVSWSLAPGDGTKSVSARVTDGVGNSRTLAAQSIVLDTAKPSVPGTLGRTVSCAGNQRTVTISWGVSTDTNFRGYRVYRSTDGASWSALTTSSASAVSDTTAKTLDSLRYYVVGYDKAGNESDATNVVSLAKNQCS